MFYTVGESEQQVTWMHHFCFLGRNISQNTRKKKDYKTLRSNIQVLKVKCERQWFIANVKEKEEILIQLHGKKLNYPEEMVQPEAYRQPMLSHDDI